MKLNPNDPVVESIDGDCYRLTQRYDVKFAYWLRELQFSLPEGYVTDLASVPRWARVFIDRASLGLVAPIVHDYLCDNKGKVTTLPGELYQIHWFDAHLLFLILMRLDGVVWHRALITFLAVLIGGPKWQSTLQQQKA